MGKLKIYYKKQNNMSIGEVLKIKIDESIKAEIKSNEFVEFDLEDREHNIKMYFEGFTEAEIYGYIDQNIEIQGNNYYIYTAPRTPKGKVKFEKKEFNSDEDFVKFVKQTNKKYKIFTIILLILCFLLLLILE